MRWHNFYKSLREYKGKEITNSFLYEVSNILMLKPNKDNIKRKLTINVSTKYRQKSLKKILVSGIPKYIKSYIS